MRDFLSFETIRNLPIATDVKTARNEILEPLKTVLLLSQYIPLDGNTEKFLGDAIAVANSKFILVECKQFLDKDGWEREALPRGITMAKESKAKNPNPNGKNRAGLFRKLKDRKLGVLELKSLSIKCHCLVGMKKGDDRKVPITSKGAILQWTPYWSFICGEKEDFNGPFITPTDIEIMETGLGVDVDTFKQYIYCLLDEDIEGTTLEDVAWIEREMVIIEMQELEKSGKIASLSYSIGAEDLLEKLGDNNSYRELIKKLAERKALLFAQKEIDKNLATGKPGNARSAKKND